MTRTLTHIHVSEARDPDILIPLLATSVVNIVSKILMFLMCNNPADKRKHLQHLIEHLNDALNLAKKLQEVM